MSGSDENVGEFSACPHCARTFNPSALERHIVICLKTSKKRKVFDSSMQRRIEEATNYVSVHRSDQHINKKSLEVAGEAKTKLVDYSKVPSRIANANTATTKRDAIKRDAIKRNAIKKSTTSTTTTIGKLAPKFANKMVQTSRTSSMETLTTDGSARAVAAKRKASPKVAPQKSNHIERAKHASSVEPSSSHRIVAQRQSLQTCIHCKRSFNERAYAGHVAWCRDRYLGNPFSQYGTNVSSEAKQRLHLRTKYKPPVPKNRSPRN